MSPDLPPVSYSGAPGAYSEEAARRAFGPTVSTLTCTDVAAALDAVSEGRARAAVVAVENSVTGSFPGLADTLVGRDLAIAGEVVLPLRHCLMAVPGARMEGIAEVLSHPSALGQCRDWIARSGWAARAADDTAAAAQELVAKGEAGTAVLGSRVLAGLYGLEILAEGIADSSENVTRFLVFTATGDAAGRRTAVLVGPVDEPRTLRNLRIHLESLDATRVRAPFVGARDGRTFLVEFDHPEARGVEIAEQALARVPFRLLGSWDCRRVG